jgi:hypothetical protein
MEILALTVALVRMEILVLLATRGRQETRVRWGIKGQ